MDEIFNGVEVLRKTLEDFTGEKFVYAGQEAVLPYPIGVLTRISEVPLGQAHKEYNAAGEEIVRQIMDVTVQVDFITAYSQTDPKNSMFGPRAILNNIVTGYYSEQWQSKFRSLSLLDGVDVIMSNAGSLTGPDVIEGSEKLFSAKMMILLGVTNFYKTENFPCIQKSNLFPLDIRISLKRDRDSLARFCGPDKGIKTGEGPTGVSFEDAKVEECPLPTSTAFDAAGGAILDGIRDPIQDTT